MNRTSVSALAFCALIAGLLTAPSAGSEQPDLEGRTALMAQIEETLDAGSWEQAEADMARFRQRYPPSSRVKGWDNGNEVVYLFPAVSRLARQYEEAGDLDKTLALYEAELDVLSTEVPHYSWGLVGLRVPLRLELGLSTAEELRADLETHRLLFERMAGEVESPGRRNLFEGLASRMTSALHHLDLVGEPAPGFTFGRAYNASLPVAIEDYRGQVVVIDFWATWCAPCMAAWPELQELYAAHRDRGLEILGITSVVESHGNETPEREVEIAERLIEENGIEWPILFSDRPVNDPEYGATTLPSYAIIDRAGRLERILVGRFGGLGERIVARLLAESVPSADTGAPETDDAAAALAKAADYMARRALEGRIALDTDEIEDATGVDVEAIDEEVLQDATLSRLAELRAQMPGPGDTGLSGQHDLVTLESFEQFVETFDEYADVPRLVLLLSPT